MFSLWELPSSLTVGGEDYVIRTDFRAAIDLLCKLADPNYEQDEKAYMALKIIFYDWEQIPPDQYEEAMHAIQCYIDMSDTDPDQIEAIRSKPVLMDWEQDGAMIISAVNKVLGYDVRAIPWSPQDPASGLHWWTFLSAYMEIGEGLFAQVLHIRSKKAKGKKLEAHETEFVKENKALVTLKEKRTDEELEDLGPYRALYKKHKNKE